MLVVSIVARSVAASAASGSCAEAVFGMLEPGVSVETQTRLLSLQLGFIAKAKALNPGIRILDPSELDQLMGDRTVVGFVGYSGGKAFDAQASEQVVREMLAKLDPRKVILSSGGTGEGLPELIYRIGHEMGFQTLGVTSLKSGEHAPARMDYLLTSGHEWGQESGHFLQSSDIIVAVGGGKQSYAEIVQARRMRKEVILVANDRIGGASRQARGRKVKEGEVAADQVNRAIQRSPFAAWQRALPKNATVVAPHELRAAYPGKRLVGFTGWSTQIPAGRGSHARKFVTDLLSRLDPAEHVVVTSGIELGVERIIHDVASSLGFKIVAEVAQEVASGHAPFHPGVSTVVPVARSWQGRTYGFVNHVDALVSLGGGPVVATQGGYAMKRGIPFVHMSGNVRETDYLTPKENSTSSGSKAASRLLGEWKRQGAQAKR